MRLFPVLIILALCLAGWKNPPGKGASIVLQFDHVVGDSPLQFDSVTYHNALEQPFQVSMFKYYIGQFQLHRRDGGWVKIDTYHFIDAMEEASCSVSIDQIEPGVYDRLIFTLGVDSLRNCSGAQSGALDPVNGMFWSWNSGYIFLKMEGSSPLAGTPGKNLEYHIGGYRAPNNCIRTIDLSMGATPLTVLDKQTKTCRIKVDIAKMFSGKTDIDFVKTPFVTSPNKSAQIADNYANMFIIR